VAALPDGSATAYVKVFVPTAVMETAPVSDIFDVRSPAQVSVAFAPASTYASTPHWSVAADGLRVITGASVSTTATVRVAEPTLPDGSAAE